MKIITNRFKPLYGIVLVNIIGFILLYFYRKPLDITTIYFGVVVLAVVCSANIIIIRMRLGDEYLVSIISMLISIGMIMLYRLDRDIAYRQITWLLIGTGIFFICYYFYIKTDNLDWLLYYYLGISLFLFLVTLIFGSNIRGANNWIVIGKYYFQPSELIKVLYVLFLASYHANRDKLNIGELNVMGRKITVKGRLVFFAINYLYIFFLALQKEFGSVLLLFCVYLIFLYVNGSRKISILLNTAAALLGGVLGYFYLYHVKVRVDIWINPWEDIANKGYQITQSLFAIASGGFFGTGLGLGRPDFIPDVHTDFIFSAICEEMGILGGTAVILLFFIFVYRGFKISLMVKGAFDKALAFGVTLVIALQTFIILGGVVKLIPLTGITLPFISYGGSSLISSFVSVGILQAISKKSC